MDQYLFQQNFLPDQNGDTFLSDWDDDVGSRGNTVSSHPPLSIGLGKGIWYQRFSSVWS